MAELAERMGMLGVRHVQVALYPLVFMDEAARRAEIQALRTADIVITAGMVGFPTERYTTIATIRESGGLAPDAEWPMRRQLMAQAGRVAAEMGLGRLSMHIGFVPRSDSPKYKVLVERAREVAARLGGEKIDLLMESGQERAGELLQFINDVGEKNLGVNFDPANMILYGAGDPIEAIGVLGRHIRHVHVKDATLSSQPGITWGDETRFGSGEVDAARFLGALQAIGYTGPLIIEREHGDDRLADVSKAIATLQSAAEGTGGDSEDE